MRALSSATSSDRPELLNSWRFDSLLEALVIIEDWRLDYNANRPHTGHGELTPNEFALQWTTTHQPQAALRLDHQTGPPPCLMGCGCKRRSKVEDVNRPSPGDLSCGYATYLTPDRSWTEAQLRCDDEVDLPGDGIGTVPSVEIAPSLALAPGLLLGGTYRNDVKYSAAGTGTLASNNDEGDVGVGDFDVDFRRVGDLAPGTDVVP